MSKPSLAAYHISIINGQSSDWSKLFPPHICRDLNEIGATRRLHGVLMGMEEYLSNLEGASYELISLSFERRARKSSIVIIKATNEE